MLYWTLTPYTYRLAGICTTNESKQVDTVEVVTVAGAAGAADTCNPFPAWVADVVVVCAPAVPETNPINSPKPSFKARTVKCIWILSEGRNLQFLSA
jgi:hypothetical protein